MPAIHPFFQWLVDEKKLTPRQAHDCHQRARDLGCTPLRALLKTNFITAPARLIAIAQFFHCISQDLNILDREELESSMLHEPLLRHHHVLPLWFRDGQLWVAMDDPSDRDAVQAVQFYTEKPLKIIVVDSALLQRTLHEQLQQKDHARLKAYFSQATIESISPPHGLPSDAPVIQWIDRFIHQAIQRGASDLHFEPYRHTYRVRSRQDGVLQELDAPPHVLASRIAARLKVMSNLDLAENRRPQDGRFQFSTPDQAAVDCRVSTCPTITGEKIVVRLLYQKGMSAQLDHLGLREEQKKHILNAIAQPQGLILITGPTGSGKTQSLYALLHHLNTTEKNIFTAEDPVEIQMQGLHQVNVHPAIGLNFETLLRSFLRQDPDIIMLGEIRDRETAIMAMQAAQTGHLVLSTVHSNNAIHTLSRLQHLGVDATHLAAFVPLIIAQRLVRTLCTHCKVMDRPCTLEQQHQFDIHAIDHAYRAQGCLHCQQGYHGRQALFEILPVSFALQECIVSHASYPVLQQQAMHDGLQTLAHEGLLKIKAGLTSFAEVERVVGRLS